MFNMLNNPSLPIGSNTFQIFPTPLKPLGWTMIVGERIPVSVLCQGILGGSIGVFPQHLLKFGGFLRLLSFENSSHVPYNGLINGEK